MSFGKPKNPLLELVHPDHTNFHIDKLERQMRGEPHAARCGCTFSASVVKNRAGEVVRGETGRPKLRGRILTRCPQHHDHYEPVSEDELKDE